MDVTPLIRNDAQVIQSYEGGKFRVSGQVYEGAIIVTPEKTFAWEVPQIFTDLMPDHFRLLATLERGKPDVVFLGTGKTMRFIAPDLKRALKEQGLSPEPMDSGAACRTYNVLMAEGRRVAAALLPAT